jgi:putative ABC transport system permease protein
VPGNGGRVNGLGQDILYGIRTLAKKPLLAAVVVLSLAVGIGLNTAIFTLMNSILLRSLPYPEPDRLVTLSTFAPNHPEQLNGVSVPDLFAWRQQAGSFEAIGALVNNAVDFGAEENGQPAERIVGENVTPGVLQALGAQPMMGRLFTEEEDAVDNAAAVVIISHRLWMRRFGGAQDILNHKVLVNGRITSIIGVMPPDFRFTDENGDYLAPIPINHFQLRGSQRYLTVAARLKRGVSLAQAQSEMDALSARLAQQIPADMDHGKPWQVRLQPIREALFGFIGRPLMLLQGAVGFVLLIACANVAALLMARASSRRTEVAIRAALGAGRGRLFRQFLTESLMLSLLSGVVGVALAWELVHLLVAMAPSWLPRLHSIGMDAPVLVFSAGVSLVTGLIFGIIPAAQGSRASFVESIKSATRGGTPGGARNRMRSVLVACQLALALVLLIGSGLLIRSFLQLQSANLGCDPNGLLTFRYRFTGPRFSKPVGPYRNMVLWDISPIPGESMTRVLDRLQTVPGVHSAAGVVYPPLAGSYPVNFTIKGREVSNPDEFSTDFFPVTPNYFATMKIPMLRGRDFNDRDTAGAPWVAIVNETMVRRYFPQEDPIGKYLSFDDLSDMEQPRQIVAVVKDVPASHPQTHQDPAVYIPFIQASGRSTGPNTGLRLQMTFLLRTAGDPMGALPAVRRAVEEVDRNQPIVEPRTEMSYLADQAQYPRYFSMLLGLFAAVATGLAAVGIYGVMAFTVEQRTREIGIRMALGAANWDVMKVMARQAIFVIASGVVFGLGGAMVLTRFISSQIWEVRTMDLGTFAGVTLILMAIAMLACLVPTRRAVKVDPTTALRAE